ncbi:MAG: ABC transporter ATP-binding protein [Firmicutes bacterium]|nr:ABC transporter ATP-binding protein [Bacillota bacterium]
MGETIIELKNVSKHFGAVKAINGLDLSIERGQIYALLGHNGAGKTTTLRIILGLLSTNGGSVSVFGEDPLRVGEKLRARAGVLSEDNGLYESLTVYDNLKFFAEIFGCEKAFYDKQIDYYLQEFEMLDKKNSVIKDFSLGMKKKVAIIRTLLHQPELILLDEPTNGLDPISIDKLHKIIFDMAQNHGTTFILTTHNLDEVRKVCDQITILRQGVNILTKNLKLEGSDGIFKTQISFITPPAADALAQIVASVDSALKYNLESTALTVNTTDKTSVAKLVSAFCKNNYMVYEVIKDELDLDKLYIQTEEEAEKK